MPATLAPESTPSIPVQGDSHDRALDLLMNDRAMVAQLLREHQILREAVEQSVVPSCIYDTEGEPLVWNAGYETLNESENAARIPAGETCERDFGEHGIFRIHECALSSGAVSATAISIAEIKARDAELAKARTQADAADNAKTRFLATMSHEIRTPMNGIIGMVQLLYNSRLDHKQRMYTDIISRSGEMLMTIIDDIIDLSKIESGQMMLASESFDLADSVEDAAALFATTAHDKNIDLIVRVDSALPRRMIGDAERLRQIVGNLVGNAVKATDMGHVFLNIDGTLSRRADGREMTRLVCTVQDTGPGISEDIRATVLDGVAHGDDPETRKRGSVGLGLPIVSSIVQAMGGSVAIESLPGTGTTVTVTLDLPVDAARTMRLASEEVRGKRIVVVDVTAARRTILIEKLTAWGFEAAACADAREGKALLDRMTDLGNPADMIILGDLTRLGDGGAPFLDILRSCRGAQPRVIRLASPDRMVETAATDDPLVVATVARPVRSTHLLTTLESGFGSSLAPDTPNAAEDMEPDADDVIAIEDDTASATPSSEPTERIDILVAEDNEINQFLIGEILKGAGYDFRVVSNGKQALKTWRDLAPRLILMDISMPDMSGIDATVAIRAQERGTRVPIVAVTAHALRGDRQRCIDAGMDDYLCKPVTPTGVMEVIDRWIDRTGIAKSA